MLLFALGGLLRRTGRLLHLLRIRRLLLLWLLLLRWFGCLFLLLLLLLLCFLLHFLLLLRLLLLLLGRARLRSLRLLLLLLSEAALIDEVTVYECSDLRVIVCDTEVEVLAEREVVVDIFRLSVGGEEGNQRASDQVAKRLGHGRRLRQQTGADRYRRCTGFEIGRWSRDRGAWFVTRGEHDGWWREQWRAEPGEGSGSCLVCVDD